MLQHVGENASQFTTAYCNVTPPRRRDPLGLMHIERRRRPLFRRSDAYLADFYRPVDGHRRQHPRGDQLLTAACTPPSALDAVELFDTLPEVATRHRSCLFFDRRTCCSRFAQRAGVERIDLAPAGPQQGSASLLTQNPLTSRHRSGPSRRPRADALRPSRPRARRPSRLQRARCARTRPRVETAITDCRSARRCHLLDSKVGPRP